MERKLYPLRPMQRWLIDTHLDKAKSTMMNIGSLFKLDPTVDLKRLENAVNAILKYHDIFRCRLALDPESGDICQYFDERIAPAIYMRMNDEQLKHHLQYLRMPFDLMEAPLYRMYIIETDAANYFYADFYHAMLDGTSAGYLFPHELDMRYRGREFKRPSVSYEQYLIERQKISPSEIERQGQYWREMFGDFDMKKHLPPADYSDLEHWSKDVLELPLENIKQDFFKGKKISMNTFFVAATMLTIAKSAGQSDAKMTWVHNGRMTMQEQRMMSLMIEQYPIAWDFKNDQTVSELLSGLDEKINDSLNYREGLAAVYSEDLAEACVVLNLRKNILDYENGTVRLGDTMMQAMPVPDNDYSVTEYSPLDIDIYVNDDGSYSMRMYYDSYHYPKNAMEDFKASFDEICRKLQDRERMVSTILS